jgi:hypothetical protein
MAVKAAHAFSGETRDYSTLELTFRWTVHADHPYPLSWLPRRERSPLTV